MSHNDGFDEFLKKNAPTPPPSPLGEKQRIWRAIEGETSQVSWWAALDLSRTHFRFALSFASVALVAIVFIFHRGRVRDERIERVLELTLAYQISELEDSNEIF